jgi:hypothetical protein
VTGPSLRGRVLPAGADYQLLKSPRVTELVAKYAIETDEGDHVYIDNFGLRTGDSEDIARLVRGEEVDPQRIYFRCNPRMQASGSRWSWLSQRILIAAGRHFPDEVRRRLRRDLIGPAWAACRRRSVRACLRACPCACPPMSASVFAECSLMVTFSAWERP